MLFKCEKEQMENLTTRFAERKKERKVVVIIF